MDRALRQGEGVGVPLEDREGVRHGREDGIGAARLGQGDVGPAEFRRGAQVVFRAIGPGQQLRAKADAENGFVGHCIGLHQAGQRGQVGVGVVVGRGLFAAEHHQRVRLRYCGQGLAGPGPMLVDQRGAFVQRDADLAVVRDAGILDDGDAHGGSCLRGDFAGGAGRGQEPDLPLRPGAGREKGNRQTTLAPGGKTHGDS